MTLPLFREDGWLPIGHHSATWQEVTLLFGAEPNSHRATILASLLKWRDAARAKGMAGLVVLNGSFISNKENPGDFDLLFSYDDATELLVRNDPEARVFTDYQGCRDLGILGDIFALPSSIQNVSPMLSGLTMFDFDRQGEPKGVVEVFL